MPVIRVCIAGVFGWAGRAVAAGVLDAPDLALVSGVSRSETARQATPGTLTLPPECVIAPTVAQALEVPAEVLVDYTSATIVKANVLTAIGRGVHVVIGSSGLTDEDFEEIDGLARAKGVGVAAVANFAASAVLFEELALVAAARMDSWEIFDFASASKIDAPSGMARQLASSLAPHVRHPAKPVVGLPETRGANVRGTPVHSVRLPGQVIGAEIVFGSPDERLTIRYDGATTAAPYVAGTLVAIRRVPRMVGLVRGPRALRDEEPG